MHADRHKLAHVEKLHAHAAAIHQIVLRMHLHLTAPQRPSARSKWHGLKPTPMAHGSAGTDGP